jgi:hypothetical protein
MQPRRIIQAKQPAIHTAAFGELRHYRRYMTASALNSSSGFQFREEADDHAQSLPTAAPEGKLSLFLKPVALLVRPDKIAGAFRRSHPTSGIRSLIFSK